MRWWGFLGLVLVVAFIGGACGGDDDDGNGGTSQPTQASDSTPTATAESTPQEDEGGDSSAPVSACDIVTPEEAETILGQPVDPLESVAGSCQYTATASGDFVLWGLTDLGSDDSARAMYEQVQATAPDAEELAGLGEEGQWDPFGRTVHVLKGRHLLVVIVQSGSLTDEQSEQAAIELAGAVADRLP